MSVEERTMWRNIAHTSLGSHHRLKYINPEFSAFLLEDFNNIKEMLSKQEE